jgi:6-phosphogluconate dehydrogenase (decarboxylating)
LYIVAARQVKYQNQVREFFQRKVLHTLRRYFGKGHHH